MPNSIYRVGRSDGPPDFFIATPSGSGRPCANFVMSLVDSVAYLAKQGMTFDFWLHSEDCHVDDARNFLVRQFLQTGAKSMVFIDDDVGWDAESLAKLVLFKDVDIVGGAYPLKQNHEDYPVRTIAERELLQARPDGLLEVEGIPTGFMRIERHVIEKMAEHRRHLTYRPKGFHADEPPHQVLFERMIVDGKRWSGDLNFCREARLLGFKVWLDPEMSFTHQGQQRWAGHLGNWLRRKQGIVDHRLDVAMDKLAAGDASVSNINEIWRRWDNHYSAGPDMIHAAYHMAQKADGPILEVGAGITTLVMGMALQRTGQMVHALEHDLEWFRAMRDYIRRWKIKGIALYYAPMQEHRVGDDAFMWYEVPAELPQKFALAIIDGPPRKFGRGGVFKLLLDRIKDCPWVQDDVDDPSQLALIKKYAAEAGKAVEERGRMVRDARRYAVAT